MNRLTTRASVAAVLLSLVFVACDSSDDPVEPEPAEPTSLSGTVGPAGGTLTSGDGRLSITFPPNALGAPTQIRISEADAASAKSVFDGFEVVEVLDVEPTGLALAVDAELSYRFPLRAGTVRSAARTHAGRPDEPETFVDVLVALLEDQGEKVLLPDQDADYNLDLRRAAFDIRMCYLGQMVFGRVIQEDNPEAGDDFGIFGMNAWLDETPVQDQEFQMGYHFWASDVHGYNDGGGMTMVDPPTIDIEAGLDDGEPVESIIDELDGFKRHTFNPAYTPRVSGDLKLNFSVGFDLNYNWGLTDLPDALAEPDIGDIRVTLRYKAFGFDVLECQNPPCDQPPPGGQFDIATGMNNLKDLSTAFYDPQRDPPPLGDGPWLFVTSDSLVRWYRLVQDQQSKIIGYEEINELPWISSTGTIPVAQGSPGSRDRCLFLFGGLSGGWRTHWNETDYGAIVLEAGHVTDASAYLGRSDSRGWVWTNGSSVRFAEYDPSVGLYFETNEAIPAASFPESNGGATAAAVGDDIETVMVVTDGSPGEVWWHDRADPLQEALKIGVAGNGAAQMRTANLLFAISNNGSASITTGLFTGAVLTGTHPVGPEPLGIDMVALVGGGAAVVCTSRPNNTYTVLTLDGAGQLVSNETHSMPGGCAAQYAIFVPGPVTYIALSCAGNRTVTLLETTLQAAL